MRRDHTGGTRSAVALRSLVRRLGWPTVAIGCYYVVYLAAYFGSGLTGQARMAWSDGAYLPLNLAGVLLAARAAGDRLAGLRSQVAWAAIAAALTFQTLGDAGWFYLEGIRQVSPFPSFADVGYVGMYPLMLLGLLLFPARRSGWRDNVVLGFDAATVVGAGFMVIWAVSLGPAVAEGLGSLEAALNIFYPVGDLLLVLGAVSVALRGGSRALARPMGVLLVGLSCWIVSDVAFSYLSAAGEGTGGGWVDLTWIAALSCFAISADQHRLAVRRDAARPAPPARSNFDDIRAPARLPYLAMLAGYVVVARAAFDLPLYPLGGLLMADVALTVAVVARQLLAASEHAQLAARYRNAALTDELTGLLNRRHFFDLGADRLALDARASQPSSAMLVDIDHFKDVNDTYGHLVGDAVLVEIAALCQTALRAGDLLCRFGGDEFVILLPNTGHEAARTVADRMVATIAVRPVDAGHVSVPVTLSAGFATREHGAELTDLIRCADVALYEVKQFGRGRALGYAQPGATGDGEAPAAIATTALSCAILPVPVSMQP